MPIKTKRFSKALLVEELRIRIYRIQSAQKFDHNNGTAQLKPGDIDRAVEYGRMMAYREMLDYAKSGH